MNLVYDSESVTHLHLLSVLVTEINKKKSVCNIINILDAGCGNGHLTVFLQVNLVAFFPEMEFHIYGYDIADHGVQAKNFFLETAKWCEEKCPDIKWDERLKLISHDQSWPFESGFFDFVVSNQVLEHVWNHRQFFSEHSRILKKFGLGIHLFPLKHYIYEGHLLIPFVHRISDWYLLKNYISFMSKIGFGKYRKGGLNLEDFSEKHADYMTFYTNYLLYSELMAIVKQAQLRPSLKYTADFYWHKLRQLFKQKIIIDLKSKNRSCIYYWFAIHSLKYISGITLLVEKDNVYSRQ